MVEIGSLHAFTMSSTRRCADTFDGIRKAGSFDSERVITGP